MQSIDPLATHSDEDQAMGPSWTLNFGIDDSPLRNFLDELVDLFRRNLLTREDRESFIDMLQSGEIALSSVWRDFRSDPTTRTGVANVLLEPGDSLVDLLATIRARPAKPRPT